MRKLLVKKHESSYETTEQDTTDNDYTFETETTEPPQKRTLQLITKTGYVRPPQGTYQDRLTKEEIIKKLEGYVPLKTMEEKKQLVNMTPFRTYVKYYNVPTKKFRTGGLLLRVSYPDYIMLANPSKELAWSVQLKENIFYIPHPKKLEEIEERKRKEKEVKQKLFDLYQKGLLTTKK
jgi:hypothetical protein